MQDCYCLDPYPHTLAQLYNLSHPGVGGTFPETPLFFLWPTILSFSSITVSIFMFGIGAQRAKILATSRAETVVYLISVYHIVLHTDMSCFPYQYHFYKFLFFLQTCKMCSCVCYFAQLTLFVLNFNAINFIEDDGIVLYVLCKCVHAQSCRLCGL